MNRFWSWIGSCSRRATSRLRIGALALCLLPQPLLAMPVPGEGPDGDAAGDRNTGENRLTIPIPVPPAAGGFGPALNLRY